MNQRNNFKANQQKNIERKMVLIFAKLQPYKTGSTEAITSVLPAGIFTMGGGGKSIILRLTSIISILKISIHIVLNYYI